MAVDDDRAAEKPSEYLQFPDGQILKVATVAATVHQVLSNGSLAVSVHLPAAFLAASAVHRHTERPERCDC